MGDIQNTQYFKAIQETPVEVSRVLKDVYIALTEKGYNPINQIVGYIMSGDPTYITSHKGCLLYTSFPLASGFSAQKLPESRLCL